jgi:hypothetical protein
MIENLFESTFARRRQKTNPILPFTAQKMFGRCTRLAVKQSK